MASSDVTVYILSSSKQPSRACSSRLVPQQTLPWFAGLSILPMSEINVLHDRGSCRENNQDSGMDFWLGGVKPSRVDGAPHVDEHCDAVDGG